MNIRDFARLSGFSTATVSRVFSHDPKVKQTTAERIRKLAEQYDFRPSAVAQSAFNGKTRSIGVLLCSLRTSYFADIAQGIQEVLLPEDYLPIMVSLRGNGDFVSMRRLVDHRVDGIIACISDENFTEAELREIERFNLPVVTIDAFGQRFFSDNISSDENACGKLAAEYLLSKGHREICFLSGSPSPVELLPRYRSFREVLGAHGVPMDTNSVFSWREKTSDGMCAALQDWLKTKSLPCACYCYNDNDAQILYEAAYALGLRIPEEISVIGTADLNFASVMVPKLTTIRQNGIEIGALAAHAILRRLNADGREHYKQISNVTLVERNSVSDLKKKGRK